MMTDCQLEPTRARIVQLTEFDHESQRDEGRGHLGFKGQSNELGDGLHDQRESYHGRSLTRSVLTHPVFDRVRP